jgi:NDP-sugar pyrophosphorylase family protein
MQAVILAGGKGTRLRPYTVSIPKPLVPIGDIPILEVVLRQLRYYGFTEVILAVNHLAEIIMAVFGDGSKFGIRIRYSIEDQVLGTAGPLSLIEGLADSFLVMNGDLLTTLDYGRLMRHHVASKNDVTITGYPKDVKIDLGVLETDGSMFQRYIEKPTYSFLVSTGVYALSASILPLIPRDEKLDLPDLVSAAHAKSLQVRVYRDDFFWLDIGRAQDYERAIEIFQERRTDFIPE